MSAVARGEMGRARVRYARLAAEQDPPVRGGKGDIKSIDRTYLLNRLRLMMLTLAEGYVESNENTVQELFDLLRRQGLNRDKTVASVLLNEDLKTWKGEPFEQAMAFCYIGVHYATLGDWGNMRAATENSIFYLRDFGWQGGDGGGGAAMTAERFAKEMAAGEIEEDDYRVVESNFTLGYLLNAVANQQLGRVRQAEEGYADVVKLDPRLAPLVRRFKGGGYNAVLVVDYGLGPEKVGAGPDRAVAEFVPVDPSGEEPLVVRVGMVEERYPWVLDLNTIATDLMWNNLEDMRLAKSYIGSALMVAGAAVADSGSKRDSEKSQYLGYGLMVAGLFAKAGAHADTRYCEVMPQRVYVVPVSVPEGGGSVTVAVEGRAGASVTVADVPGPVGGGVALRYVRLPSGLYDLASWAGTGEVRYGNVYRPDAGERRYPYILGGDSVLPPTYRSLGRYQEAGYLRGMTLSALQDLYRAEDIEWESRPGRAPKRHVLEGGRSLVAPLPGTVGYTRLFCNEWPAYVPRSRALRRFLADRGAEMLPGR